MLRGNTSDQSGRGTSRIGFGVLAAVGAILLPVLGSGPAQSRTGLYRIAMLRVTYSDGANHLWTRQQFDTAAGEIHDFFDRLSYSRLDVRVTVVDVTLPNTQAYYFDPCAPRFEQRRRCPPPLIEEAAQAAAKKFRFKGIDGIVLVSPACRGDWTNAAITITRPGVNGTFQRSYDFECALPANLPAPGPSGVVWNGWAHEIGHQLQFADGGTLGGKWNGHPSSYASGYELMDSCYPCGESVYGLSGPPIMNGQKKVFPGFLDPGRVVTVPAPASGTQGQTLTLTPLGFQPGMAGFGGPQGVKIPLSGSGSRYYEVTGRSNWGADAYSTGPGLWDQGVRIRKVDEAADPPVSNIESCDYPALGLSSRCLRDMKTDPRAPNCRVSPPTPAPQHRGDLPDYCWPYPLWHKGQQFEDRPENLTIRIDDELTSSNPTFRTGFVVSVIRGPDRRRRPDLYVQPEYTAPLFTFESRDIWIDSSCNGYVHDYRRTPLGVRDFGVGARGVRYGLRADGTPIGNGDDFCLDHPNRIYVRVRNIGDAPARAIRLHVRVQSFPNLELPGVDLGILGFFGSQPLFPPAEVGMATRGELDAGESADLYVPWTLQRPANTSPFARIQIPLAIRASFDAVANEIVTTNQSASEAISYFEAVPSQFQGVIAFSGFIGIANRFKERYDRTFTLTSPVGASKDLTFVLGKTRGEVTLRSGALRRVPIRITVRRRVSRGQTLYLTLTQGTITQLVNRAIPPAAAERRSHNAFTTVGAGAIAVTPVESSSLVISVRRAGSAVVVNGRLTPHKRAWLTIDLVRARRRQSRTVPTNRAGRYRVSFKNIGGGLVRVAAFWQGDRTHARASSLVVQVHDPR